MSAKTQVTFTFEPSSAGSPALGEESSPRDVRVLGEVLEWREGARLSPRPDGSFAVDLWLPDGAYAYKLLVDGRWIVPPGVRTVTSGEHTNALLVVNGADEPFVFAPGSPYVDELDHGVRVHVGVRTSDDLERVEVSVTHEASETGVYVPLPFVFRDGDLAHFAAEIPWLAKTCALRIRTGDSEAGPFVYERREASEKTVRSARDGTFYTVFVDRFRRERDDGWELYTRSDGLLGGHLEGIRRSLDHFVSLGIDHLVLTPIGIAESSHRYDFVDPLRVDPKLGGERALERLVTDAHARGLRIVLDFAFSHAGASFPPAASVLAEGRASSFASWFRWSNDPEPKLLHYGTRTCAPLLDLTAEGPRQLVLDAVDRFAALGVDGLRLDMTAELPLDLGREIRRRFRTKVPGAFVYGEVVPEHAFRFRGEGVVCASTDFGFFEAVSRIFGRGQGTLHDLREVVRRGELVRGGCPLSEHLRFVSTHDHPRLSTVAAAHGRDALVPTAHALLFTLPGIPMLLYGEEHGLRARDPKEAALAEVEDVWLDRVPMPWDGVGRDSERFDALKRLIFVRREHSALRRGALEWLHVEDELLVFRRTFAGEVIDVVVSIASEAREVDIEDDQHPSAEIVTASPGVSGEGSTFVVPAFGYLVASRSSARARGRLTPRARANLRLVDEDMAHARTHARSRPTRIDFSVTEACNLRCIHCITHAPRLTREKKAKTLTEPTLDALREDLAFARYFGFVHGGESLVTPMLRRTLEAIAEARGEEPYVVHLLSNGLLATTETVRPLVDLGLSSLSVSLDGATAETNDAIRLGGRFEVVTRNVRELVRMRRDEGLDLRLGLSYVTLHENLHETVPFVELAADLGVDWVKLEELVPQDDRTRRSLLRDPSALKEMVIRARERGRELGVRVVDHTVERRIFVCDMDAETRGFLEDDAFANRAELLPCRTPWETACIEPDGTVKLGDFFGPMLGRLGAEGRSIEELWNRDQAREARERFVRERPCGRGPATCVPGTRTS